MIVSSFSESALHWQCLSIIGHHLLERISMLSHGLQEAARSDLLTRPNWDLQCAGDDTPPQSASRYEDTDPGLLYVQVQGGSVGGD